MEGNQIRCFAGLLHLKQHFGIAHQVAVLFSVVGHGDYRQTVWAMLLRVLDDEIHPRFISILMWNPGLSGAANCRIEATVLIAAPPQSPWCLDLRTRPRSLPSRSDLSTCVEPSA